MNLLVCCVAAQFACKFYLAQWYRECSMALSKSSGTSTETASVVSESASTTDVPQRKKRKKSRRPSDDSENAADTASISVSGHCNDAQMELKQEQQWLLTQMQTGLPLTATTRFAVAVTISHLLWSPYGIGQTIIFLPCGFFFLLSFFFSSPNLSCRRLDVCHAFTHGVALV